MAAAWRSHLRLGVRCYGLALDRPGGDDRRAWELLRPGGHLAFWTAAHVFPAGGDPFSRDIQRVYDETGEALPPSTRWQLAVVANGRKDWARAKAQRSRPGWERRWERD